MLKKLIKKTTPKCKNIILLNTFFLVLKKTIKENINIKTTGKPFIFSGIKGNNPNKKIEIKRKFGKTPFALYLTKFIKFNFYQNLKLLYSIPNYFSR
jgi:hypothetical protein